MVNRHCEALRGTWQSNLFNIPLPSTDCHAPLCSIRNDGHEGVSVIEVIVAWRPSLFKE